jgi:hypothetical protein
VSSLLVIVFFYCQADLIEKYNYQKVAQTRICAILLFMDKSISIFGGFMNTVSRVGQRGDFIGNGVARWVEVLDDTPAAVWKVKDLDTGEAFFAVSSNIRFYK